MNTKILTGSGLVVAVALFLGINIIANHSFTRIRLDVTEAKLHTLSDGTRNILKDIKEPITLRFYFSAKRFSSVPEFATYGKRVRDLLDEYVAVGNGNIKLFIVDPEPFSEAEDQAVGYGIEPIPMSASGEKGFLGLVGTNSIDDEIPIPLMSPEREAALEYDLTKMIYNLSNPKKRVLGLLSGLPVLSGPPDQRTGQPGTNEWAVIKLLREVYDVKPLTFDVTKIDDDIDTLIVIHPKEFPSSALYAIDQFVIHGGRAIVFVDPFAEEDRPAQNPGQPNAMPEISSSLDPIFAKWGLDMARDKVATDIDAAVRVAFRSETGPLEVEYLPWLQLQGERLNRDDFITAELNSVNVGSAGSLKIIDGSTTSFTPLIKTGANSGLIERDSIIFVRDPGALLETFEATGESSVIAARISGIVETAFPDGRPPADGETAAIADDRFSAKSAAPINVIVVADTDILADKFWVRYENFLGMQMPQAFANNADFLINAIDNLGGNDDLISLRSRAEYSRPFVVVQQIRRDAEAQFRDRERALQAKLQETENNLQQLQQQRGDGGEFLVSPEQREEIELFRNEQIKTRKELRSVQHDLQKNIEKLGTTLKFINIGLIPILISLFAVAMGIYGSRRQTSKSPS
ncbi:MAG: ABC-type uncharacterized transport system involved in gliding motility auxiliary subunit [Gammaproteobacteria bacterium]|jgi:ABC-type uncharacterized transport system involved in gliding motility auxiliary subunit